MVSFSAHSWQGPPSFGSESRICLHLQAEQAACCQDPRLDDSSHLGAWISTVEKEKAAVESGVQQEDRVSGLYWATGRQVLQSLDRIYELLKEIILFYLKTIRWEVHTGNIILTLKEQSMEKICQLNIVLLVSVSSCSKCKTLRTF